MSYKVELIRSLFSEVLGVPVTTKNELLAEGKDLKNYTKLTPQVLIEHSRIKFVKPFIKERSCCDKKGQLFIKLLCGNNKVVGFGDCTRTIDIKRGLEEDLSIPSDEQQLVCCGKRLEDDFVIPQDYNRATLHLLSRLPGGILTPNCFIDEEDLFDHRYDYTYPSSDERQYYRGGILYKRPNGWSKIGLNVVGKYESDDWIGVHKSGKRFENAPGEWPVAYHGTSKENAISIAKYGFDEKKRVRQVYGEGDYSSPDINVASFYSQTFTYDDKTYRFVLQCRINPHTMMIIQTQGDRGESYVTKDTSDLRPYGICFRQHEVQTQSKSFYCKWTLILFVLLLLLAWCINEYSERQIVPF